MAVQRSAERTRRTRPIMVRTAGLVAALIGAIGRHHRRLRHHGNERDTLYIDVRLFLTLLITSGRS